MDWTYDQESGYGHSGSNSDFLHDLGESHILSTFSYFIYVVVFDYPIPMILSSTNNPESIIKDILDNWWTYQLKNLAALFP